MDDVKLNLNGTGHGAFQIMEDNEQVAEMVVSIAAGQLTVYHTEVSEQFEGKGLAKKLLAAMVEYARNKGLTVIALCPYVHAQFKRRPELYSDIWSQDFQKETES
jgi:predicted GNAT family acetyltransferase